MSTLTTQSAGATTITTDIDALTNDLTRLDALIAKTEEEDVGVTELLERLESAEDMAGKVEAKVDDVLAKLDEIIREMDEQMNEQSEIESSTNAKVNPDTQSQS
ncbi:hypothetical protein C0989_001239 [Termitomyces sp. Mn162]|nr:hypothetical protein C0989_001239 [Termitomyces sp. Mn162]KAH0591369.1 hypothetical protein H2248_001447 [Termitomyces sp. 'cryptogamus']